MSTLRPNKILKLWLMLSVLWIILWGFHLISARDVPKGFHHDEAFNAVDALHLGKQGWPVFFPQQFRA